MPDQPAWRVEKYENEFDPFAAIQWYVMQGDVMIAQCEVEVHAELILTERRRREAFEQALRHISSMSHEAHDLQAAIDAALRALE